MSFVKIGQHLSEGERISPKEARTVMSERSIRPTVGQAFVQSPSFEKPGLQNLSFVRLSTSSSGTRSGNDLSQIPIHNGHINHQEFRNPQGTMPTSSGTLGNLSPRADHLHEPRVRRRSSSLLSNSSEEIIIFSGRKRAKNKTLSTIKRPISREWSSEDTEGFIGLTKLSSLIDPPSMKYEHTSKPCRSTSPEGASLGKSSSTKECANIIKRGWANPDNPNPIVLHTSKKTRKYKLLADHVVDTNKIDEDDSSTIDQVSNAPDDSSTDSMELKISSGGDMANIKGSSRNQKSGGSGFELVLKEPNSPDLTVISTQVSDPGVIAQRRQRVFK